ncbi:hypothetical protein A0H76_2828 [Hepatospora eriocheir]|uniref:Kinetochore protein SPC25 n=1 Tax=Hepatospora eriocheir TaxID=1081669 RepID=A0A1X0QLF5_9MICR|nr:hypothetical protein A0H76_2828 [Hepatospora eriocheir]
MIKRSDINSVAINEIVHKVKIKINESVEELRNSCIELNLLNVKNHKTFNDEEIRLRKSIERNKIEINNLEKLKLDIDKDKEEVEILLKESENENISLKNQHKEVQFTSNLLNERFNELEEAKKSIENKLNCVSNNFNESLQYQKVLADKYKKYLGLTIYKIKENTLKFSFQHLKMPCYIIMFFVNDPLIIESEPKVDLNYLNNVFVTEKKIVKFLKLVRSEFIKSLK